MKRDSDKARDWDWILKAIYLMNTIDPQYVQDAEAQ